MKKIEFGYSNDFDPMGSFEGIGIVPGVLLTDAEYYGAINFDGNSYIVARVGENKYTQFSNLAGKFIVRDSFLDVYADGSTVLFLDQEQSIEANKLEEYVNYVDLKKGVNSVDDIINLNLNIEAANPFYKLLDDHKKIAATSILHDVFVTRRDAMKKCKRSYSSVQILLKKKTISR